MKVEVRMAAPLFVGAVFVGAAIVIAPPAFAGAGTSYVGAAVGYQATGQPKGTFFVSATAAEAQQGALQSCHEHLAACALAETSTQCIGIATGFGTKWMTAEGPDAGTAETNARAKLAELASDLSADTTGLEPITRAACARS
ncbi:DUF4189 domain-containing protein [Mycobacterium intracellulare]